MSDFGTATCKFVDFPIKASSLLSREAGHILRCEKTGYLRKRDEKSFSVSHLGNATHKEN